MFEPTCLRASILIIVLFNGSSFLTVYGVLIATFFDLLCCITCDVLQKLFPHCLWYVDSHLFGFIMANNMFY